MNVDEHETAPAQLDLALPIAEHTDIPPVPVRMLNEFVYCPRLAYLEWVQREWRDSSDTVQGRHVHRRVDRRAGALPDPAEVDESTRIHARSIELSSEHLGIVAKLDLVESDAGGYVMPVEYKRGKRPHVAGGAYDPERVQLCAQGILLEEAGYQVNGGVLYFAGSRERVQVAFDAALREQTATAIRDFRLLAAGARIPSPLEDSPKCGRCSLATICLPDETNFLRRDGGTVRPIAVEKPMALPAYVQANGARISKRGECLEVSSPDAPTAEIRLGELSQLVVMGNVTLTTPTLHELMRRQIPVSWHGHGGWFMGHTVGTGSGNVELRTAQFRGSFDEQVCLAIARGLVRAKLLNCRTLMRRNWRGDQSSAEALKEMGRFAEQSTRARSISSLLGMEGGGALVYFSNFSSMLKGEDDAAPAFEFGKRNRRPPTDPVNALLSFGYALLTRAVTTALSAVGFDVYRGFYHQPRFGRPSLALDMMEPFRPLLADSVVITAINNGEVRPTDFVRVGPAVNLSADGRKRFIATFERRMDQEITHPLFGYKLSYRRLLEVQARLLARFLLGELPEYPNFTTR